jgi:hypothetical protein
VVLLGSGRVPASASRSASDFFPPDSDIARDGLAAFARYVELERAVFLRMESQGRGGVKDGAAEEAVQFAPCKYLKWAASSRVLG